MSKIFSSKREKFRGVSLIETIVYISILIMIVSVIVGALSFTTRSYRRIQSAEIIESTAVISLDRMNREIRDASGIDTTQSVFNTSPGILMLNTTDENDVATTVKFFVAEGVIRVVEGGVDIGPISRNMARVTTLLFQSITNSQSKAIKIKMTVEVGQGESYLSKSFYSTVVLRGSYLP